MQPHRVKLDEWQNEILKQKGNIVLRSGRQVGKSTVIARLVAQEALKRRQTILVIAAVEREAMLLFDKILDYLTFTNKKELAKGKDKPTKHKLRLKNGSLVLCLPTGISGQGIRGHTVDILVADEAAFIPEEVWAAVTPMLLTTGGRVILLSTPHGREGYFYRCFGDESFFKFHINTEQVIENRELNQTWTQTQKEKAKEWLKLEKSRMSELEYTQEYLGEFIDELRQLFPDELIKKRMTVSREQSIKPNKDYYIGVDVARLGDDETVFSILRKIDRDNFIQVDNLIYRKILTTQTVKQILTLERKYKFKKVYIDDAGVGAGVFDMLLEEDDTRRKVVGLNNARKSLDKDNKRKKKLFKEDLYNNFLAMMEKGFVQLLDDPEIFQSLKSVQYEYINGELRIFGKYTHIAEALVRAGWAKKDKTLNIYIY